MVIKWDSGRNLAMYTFFLLVFLMPAHAYADTEDFNCSGAQYLVDLIEEGIDEVYAEISSNPRSFLRNTIRNWECVPEPLNMEQGGRRFLDKLVCVYSNQRNRVSRSELKRAGKIFRRNIKAVTSCFKGEIMSSTSRNYVNETHGEGIIILVNRRVNKLYSRSGRIIRKNRILLEYGYVRAAPGNPLFWTIHVGISVHDSANN